MYGEYRDFAERVFLENNMKCPFPKKDWTLGDLMDLRGFFDLLAEPNPETQPSLF